MALSRAEGAALRGFPATPRVPNPKLPREQREMNTEMSLISKCCSANQGTHSLLLLWHCHPITCTEQSSPCSPRNALGWAGTGRTYAAETARYQHMLRSPGGSSGIMTGFLWINQPAELLLQCSAPKHAPSSRGDPRRVPDHPGKALAAFCTNTRVTRDALGAEKIHLSMSKASPPPGAAPH